MNNDFDIVFFSDSQYEEITVEISFKGQIICQLNKDNGSDNIEIELFSDARILQEKNEMKFFLNDFLQVLSEAKDDLIKS